MKALTYEQRLTAIFETERKAKAAAERKLDTAKAECKRMEDQAQAEAALQAAEQAHAAELSAAEETARSAYTDLRAELAEKVRRASLVNPDDVEPLALELLESGVMKADDFAALAERYSENPTMLRLVALHARKGMYAAAGAPMSAERDALAGVVESCNRCLTAELDSFDRLTAKLSAEGSPEC